MNINVVFFSSEFQSSFLETIEGTHFVNFGSYINGDKLGECVLLRIGRDGGL